MEDLAFENSSEDSEYVDFYSDLESNDSDGDENDNDMDDLFDNKTILD